ncbi:MAG: UDP-3-O-(3-hydroxymyristoyl)glucosamine N-acyltransferase [Candidatus Nanopelagicales bacterium]
MTEQPQDTVGNIEVIKSLVGPQVIAVVPGSGSDAFTKVAPLIPGSPGGLSFFRPSRVYTINDLVSTASSVVIVSAEGAEPSVGKTSFHRVVVEDARTVFIQVVNALFAENVAAGRHPSATIDPSATLGEGCHIGPGVHIENANIGSRCVIHANAIIRDNVVLGDDVIVGPSSVIGNTGFGYGRDAAGIPIPFTHFGGVHIGNRVEIGANTTIDRGTLENTVIEDDVKIDNLVNIGHNCVIGRSALIIAGSALCGGVTVGEGAWISPNSTIREKVQIGSSSVVGLAAVVINDVAPGTTVFGNPARRIKA